MKSFLRENGLALFFAALFASTLVAHSIGGQHHQNAELAQHGSGSVSWWEYVTSPEFWGAVMENWQSEFLQFAVFIAATIWFVQKGSNESKKLDDVGLETDEQQKLGEHTLRRSPLWAKAGGVRTALYSNSLLLVMSAIFLTSWFAQSLGDWRTFNAGQREHSDEPISWGRYLLDPDFWEKTLQNWQSEFLAIGVLVAFTIYLRQRGSPESKPVGAPHDETASSG
jgi:hypothetical protein